MHIRLKFRSHLITKKLTHGDSLSRALVAPGERDRNSSREVGDALWREKAKIGCPYRKPTQVDEERILRPTGEGLLRTSAKLPRNFGRRGACESRPQRIGPSDCLPKTQVSAKSKDDV